MSELKPMTARRAIYFMERFKKAEKLLGPNEQAAVDYVIAMLEAQDAQPAQAGQVLTRDEIEEAFQQAAGADEETHIRFARTIEQVVLAKRVPMTREEVKDLVRKVGYDNATAQERADFINGIRHAEVWRGIVGEKGTTP